MNGKDVDIWSDTRVLMAFLALIIGVCVVLLWIDSWVRGLA